MSRVRRAARRQLSETDILDEQEQEEFIQDLEQENEESKKFFQIAFICLFLIPTPVYTFLPYCRRNSFLSFLSLVSIIISAYEIYFLEQRQLKSLISGLETNGGILGRKFQQISLKCATSGYILSGMNIIIASAICVMGYIEHKPWKGYDYVWIYPLFSATSAAILKKTMLESRDLVKGLHSLKYKYKGA